MLRIFKLSASLQIGTLRMNMYLQKIAQVPNQNTTVTCNEQFYSFITVKQYSFRLHVSSHFEKNFIEY